MIPEEKKNQEQKQEETTLLEFVGVRKHFFKDKHYHI